MTTDKVMVNYEDVREATVEEIVWLHDLGCFQRWPRHRSNNIIRAQWVIMWKMVEGNFAIKCRLAVRGFNCKLQHLDTYAGTTGRAVQRLANALEAENPDFVLSSFDVRQAFARGMVFRESRALTGTELREAKFDVPRSDLECFRQIKGFNDFNPQVETLTMLKPIYGLKGAPRAWRKQLHQVSVCIRRQSCIACTGVMRCNAAMQ